MSATRIFFVGGLLSFRALFSFLRPEVYIPALVLAPIFQILLFVYIGRSAGLESDEFYVIGNAVQYAAIPCLFAMIFTIAGERYQGTLGYIVGSPAPRIPLFLGRALPVVANGFFLALVSLAIGALLVDVSIPPSGYLPLALAVGLCALSCTGLGLVGAGIGLLLRDQAVLGNIMFGVLLIFTGANVPAAALPEWMQTVGSFLPFTHGIVAAREIADGAGLGDVAGLLWRELAVGVVSGVIGFLFIRYTERLSRRRATLDRS